MQRSILAAVLTALLLVAAPAAHASETAEVFVVHGISGGSLGLADFGFPVDVYIGGVGCAIENFTFTNIVGPVALPGGDYEIKIFPRTPGLPGCSGEAALMATVSVKGGESYDLVAHLDGNGGPTLSAFGNVKSSARTGEATAVVRHTAWAPEVGVLARRGGDTLVLGEFANGAELGPVALPNRKFGLGLGLPGSTDPVFGFFDQNFKRGREYYIYAFGWVGNGTLTFVVRELLR